MDRNLKDEFAELYPDRCKGVLNRLEKDMLELKLKGEATSEGYEKLLHEVSKLRVRCMVFEFRKHVEMLKKMSNILEHGALPPEGYTVDILIAACEHLKKYFLGDEPADETEIETLIFRMVLLKAEKIRFSRTKEKSSC